MKDPARPDNRRKYDAAFRAEALRLAEQSRSTQAAARALNINPKRICQRQKSCPNAREDRIGRSLGPGYGRRTAPTAGPGPAVGAGTGDFKKATAIFSQPPNP